MTKKIYALIIIIFVCFISMTPIYAKETEIHDMKIDVTIDQRGNAHIEETWSMSVHEGTEVL